MSESVTVFETTYKRYLTQLAACDYLGRAAMLGGEVGDEALTLPFLTEPFSISPKRVTGPEGDEAGFSESVVLFNYILRCPALLPARQGWITYREVKDSGPLAVHFSNNAVVPVEERFAGKVSELAERCASFGGQPDLSCTGYDFAVTFDLLPRIPMALRFNDADEEFPAACSLLFASDVGSWLDPESLVILAVFFIQKLTL